MIGDGFMQVKIENEQVRKNIELFLHILGRSVAAHEKKALHQRIYRAFVNRVNGEILFSDLLPDPALLEKKDWKLVKLRCDPIEKGVVFEVDESEGGQDRFHCEELAPLAYRTVADTIHMLNECAELFLKAKDPDQQIEDLSHLSIEPSSLKGPYNLIQAAWHPVDRFEAESLLFKHPYGSFIFRKEGYAKLLEEELTYSLKHPIKCFTLTYIEPEKKVCDLTIVFDQERFQIYNDDPNLSGKTYPDLTELLLDLNEHCKYPVFH